MSEIFNYWSQIVSDLDFCANAMEACGNVPLAVRLRFDIVCIENIHEVSKNEFKRFTE